jgi:hypothetical protein
VPATASVCLLVSAVPPACYACYYVCLPAGIPAAVPSACYYACYCVCLPAGIFPPLCLLTCCNACYCVFLPAGIFPHKLLAICVCFCACLSVSYQLSTCSYQFVSTVYVSLHTCSLSVFLDECKVQYSYVSLSDFRLLSRFAPLCLCIISVCHFVCL